MHITKKILVRAISPLLVSVPLLLGLGGAGQQAQTPPRVQFSKADGETLDRVSAYLNGVHSMKGRFTQIGPQGQIDRGTFYLQRPGKVRFEYDAPSPLLIVADGQTIAVANKRLNTVDRYPVSETPFSFFLGDKIDLRHGQMVMAVKAEPGTITLRARTSRLRYTSNLNFMFSSPGIELRQWVVTDPQGGTTTIALDQVETGAVIAAGVFALPKKQPAPATPPQANPPK